MREYPKINSVFKRDERNRFIEGEWAEDEIGYLAELPWRWTEKVDGTNIRVGLTLTEDGTYSTEFGGRTDNAQIPAHLVQRLRDVFDPPEQAKVFNAPGEMVIYGEGYGARIQKGGNYIPDGVDFIVFDVLIGDWWLKPVDVQGIAESLGLRTVPLVGEFSLLEAIESIRKNSIESAWSGAPIEGLVGTPATPLFNRRGDRIITKVKVRDFR